MARLRDAVLECDQRLVEILARRRDLVIRIGEFKKRLGLPVTDPQREAAVVRRAAVLARDSGLDEELVRDLIWKVIASAQDPAVHLGRRCPGRPRLGRPCFG